MGGSRGITRRRFLTGSAALAALPTLAPFTGRIGQAFAATAPDPATTGRNRLVVIFLGGGNDGLNTVVPTDDADGTQRYSVYRQVRPTIGYAPSAVLPLDRPGDAAHALALSPALPRLHGMYQEGRVAVVQGVDYPSHSFSHFVGMDTWQSGQPEVAPDSGWLGRHLDRAGVGVGELRAVAVGYELPLIFRGREKQGVNLPGIPLSFADGTQAIGDARHDAAELFGLHSSAEPLRQFAGQMVESTVDLVEALENAPATPTTVNPVTNALITARVLLEGQFGLECVYVRIDGFDTHATQVPLQEQALGTVDQAIGAFFDGDAANGIAPMSADLKARTMVMTCSEFGRRVGENGGGTDHGTASPLFLVGPAGGALVPGLHGDHPDLGTTLAPADNLPPTTDLRSVYQAVLQNWLHDPDPLYGAPMPGLFA
ncbi:MAG: hypothetical protein QOF60_104 [Actinomycetota bacterium]|jgi:uncharacterized protein (DUF1501 family)|nr:hypothetical protein [Actinomycetota bacterium]